MNKTIFRLEKMLTSINDDIMRCYGDGLGSDRLLMLNRKKTEIIEELKKAKENRKGQP